MEENQFYMSNKFQSRLGRREMGPQSMKKWVWLIIFNKTRRISEIKVIVKYQKVKYRFIILIFLMIPNDWGLRPKVFGFG